MSILDDYKAKGNAFKSVTLPIRGNIDNITEIDAVMKEHGFSSRGVALDYILFAYQKLSAVDVSRLENEIDELANENSELKAKIIELQNAQPQTPAPANSANCTPEGFKEFYEETVAAFKLLFADDTYPGHHIPDQIALMMDYCKRDPSNEFPFQPVAETIYNKHKIATDGGEQTTGAAAEQPSGNQ